MLVKMFFCLGFLILPLTAQGEILDDCSIIKQANQEGAKNSRLILAIAKIESSKNGRARNGVHYGLMQLKLGTAKMLGFRDKPTALLNWKTNLRYGVKYLDSKLDDYHGNLASAVAAYNAGAAYIKRGTTKQYVNQGYVDLVLGLYRYSHPAC